jgi:hypothetical protein
MHGGWVNGPRVSPSYAPGSVEAFRTASTAPVTADWEQRRRGILVRETPHHPDVRGLPAEPVNGPGAKLSHAIGSVEWAAAQRKNVS